MFSRALGRDLPRAVRAEGCRIWDTEGRTYLDAAGGALVVSLGHGDPEVLRAMAEQAGRISYAHGTQFTTESLETYAAEVAPLLPFEDGRIYPVSGGSEGISVQSTCQ